jgi:Transmembrane domain of unknown function (DUF3566)
MSARWPDRLGTEAGLTDGGERRAAWLDDDVEDLFGPPERKLLVLRRIDLWSALKVSLVLYLSFFMVFLATGVGLWQAARHGGGIDNAENLIQELCCTPGSFHFDGDQILRLAAVLGPIFVVLASLATVAGVAVFNLVSRLVGGVEVTVSDGDALPGL